MRSVFLHLWDTTAEEIAFTLNRICNQNIEPKTISVKDSRNLWTYTENNVGYLYIYFADNDWTLETEVEIEILSRFQCFPSINLVVDITGRHEGWPQTKNFISLFLDALPGLATDDEQLRLWTKEEIFEDRTIDGNKFGAWRND